MEHGEFLQAYADYYRDILEPTKDEIKKLTKPWRFTDFWLARRAPEDLVARSPIERIYSRIKRPESVVDKITRHPEFFKGGLTVSNMERMQDMIGVRIIVRFLSDMLAVDALLRDDCGFVVSTEIPPVAYLPQDLFTRLGLDGEGVGFTHGHKASGYASLHYIIQLRDSDVPAHQRPWFELQLRTMAEETWGQVEHQLGYKPGKGTAMAVRRQFKIIANHLGAVDEHFDFLKEELRFLQSVADAKDAEKLSAENLPSVLHELSLHCAQQEIDGLLKLLFSRGIERVGELRAAAANPERLQRIHNRYVAKLGYRPSLFDVVANLANLRDCRNPEQEMRQIDNQILYLETWNQLTGRRSDIGRSGPDDVLGSNAAPQAD